MYFSDFDGDCSIKNDEIEIFVIVFFLYILKNSRGIS